MDKKKIIFFGAIAIDIALICLAYLVFYEEMFDEDTSILLAWIVIIAATFMMIATIGLAITIPRKKHIKIRRKPKKEKEISSEEVEFKEVVDEEKKEEKEELPEFKVIEEVPRIVEKQDLEHITSKSGITMIRRVTKEDLDEIKERVDEGKSNFKDEIQQVINARTKKVEEVVDNLVRSKKPVLQNETKKTEKPPVKQKVRRKTITLEEKIYSYMQDHPDAAAGEVRKAVGSKHCKLSSAKKYRSQWLKNEGN